MGDFLESTQTVNEELACTNCGAFLKFKPGTNHLVCDYCGAKNEIANPSVHGVVTEISLDDFLAHNFDAEEKVEVATVQCKSCGAVSTLDAHISSDKCAFCASTLVVTKGTTARTHKPQYMLPFGIDEKKALENFRRWLRQRWFAPNDLKHYADRSDNLKGMYLPYWTFDCKTNTSYTGQRGINYTTQESYTAFENGKNVSRTRTVTKTRWYSVSGTVNNLFDDILIEATRSLPKSKLRALEPWDIQNLVMYNDKYLSGFRTEIYKVDVKEGYAEAKQRMEPVIRETICRDIGGDKQLIHLVSTTYQNPTFKHILLPVWLSAYRYKNKVYQFLVNARTGEVQGQRPYSTIKIVMTVLACVSAIFLLILLSGK